jgi:dimethylamine/trimethylamine dehydrogenase
MTSEARYDVLFEPVRFGPKTAKNRFFAVPHCTNAGSDRPGMQAAFRAMKAEGGWAVACVEYCSVAPEVDDTPYISARMWDEGDALNLAHTAEAVHAAGGLAGIQLCYGGANAQAFEARGTPRGPSPLPSEFAYQTYAQACDADDIAELIACYVTAAKRARDAGFDYIEVIGSDSHLPVQFLQSRYNKRTDKYGGSFENRARFWLELIGRTREVIEGRAALAVRMSVDQLIGPGGIEAGGDGMGFIELVTREGVVDMWDINISDQFEWGEDAGPSRHQKANHQAPFTREVKKIAKVPVLNVGRLTSPDDMLEVINSGQADIIGAARPSIADPFLPKKTEEGRNEDIRECIGCNVCVSRWEVGARLICTQNATAMEEYRRSWHPEKFDKPADPGNVLVVGAGPSGLECARVLGERGYDVHLVEAEGELGGHVRDVIRYPGLAEWGRVVTWRQTQIDKLKNVEVHTKTRLSTDDVLGYGADAVVLATGSTWSGEGYNATDMGAIPGVDASKAQYATPEQIMAGKETGDRVLVLDADGYFTGIAMAEMMADAGKQVSIVTSLGAVAALTEQTLEGPNIHRMLHEKNVTCYAGMWVEEIEEGNRLKVKLYDFLRDGSVRTTDPVAGEPIRTQGTATTDLEVDSVVLVTARIANDGLYKSLRERKAEWAAGGIRGVYQAGDCYAPRMLGEAIYEGHRIAREFESPNPQRPLPYKRERLLWERAPEGAY